jgi:thiol-disulfide isomerase/thioredoxin
MGGKDQRKISRAMKRILIIQLALALLFTPLGLYSLAQETLDAETQKLWDAHTVVPKTDDIKELRAFLQYGIDNWMQMNGRIHGTETWERFHTEKNKATFEAADRIIALSKNEPGEEPPPPKDMAEYYDWNDSDDLKFALRNKIGAFNGARAWNPDWKQQFQDFIEEIKKNSAHKYVLKFAEQSWFNHHFNAAVFPKGTFEEEPEFEECFHLYSENFENWKRYCEDNADCPYLKFQIDLHIHQQAAEMIERHGKLKKGTLLKPVLEFYRSLYEKHKDAPGAEGYLRMINSELAKYEILGAEDQLAAFRGEVAKLKETLEKELDENSIQKVWGLSMMLEDLDCRTEAGKLLYQTVRPIFAASDNPRINEYEIGFGIALNQLALEGLEFEFEAMLLDGTKIDLKDYRGKIVLLDYWATWCGPCIGELPMLKNVHKGYHDKGFEIIAFSVDEDVEHLKQFVEKEELPWLNASEVLSQKANLADSRQKYDINAYPTTVLIGKDGKVIRGDARGSILYKELRRLFADR